MVLSSLVIFGCKSAGGQQQCLRNYISELKDTPEYNSIRSAARDTVAHWATLNIKNFYGINRTKWEIDSAIFFNEDKNKALLLLLKVDTVSTAKLDYVQLMAAEKKEGMWYFYVQTLNSIIYDRGRYNKGRPFTFEELAQNARYELIEGGYYDKWSCNVNYAYVDDWFDNPLSDYHRFFLQNQRAKTPNKTYKLATPPYSRDVSGKLK
ncbi:hypothetical protein [Pontibacter arcticus]|uniref:Uncharacterized protein n=1 Tax=Pontibacter arcticus TaxID=2080288 RepID=A0A364RFF9_9BACT|nr:hypothetical protein [Pontibacter arcticus]RAU83014.1 hypothetical protein DP923_07200 [Pontibacter arcticus]